MVFFFSEYKITQQQASFECVDSVFTHCLLACCFKSNHNCLNTEKFAKVFRCLLGQANVVNKTVFRTGFKLHCYIQELDRYKKSKNFSELVDWPN